MSRTVVINLDTLEEVNLSLNEFFALWDIYEKYKLPFSSAGVDYERLQRDKFIKIILNEKRIKSYVLRERSIRLIETIKKCAKKSKFTKKTPKFNVDIVTRIGEFRTKWKGLKAGSMGSAQSCRDKLTRWMEENPEYTFDEILRAADHYLASLHGDYRYLQRADYFIYKQENNREESSRLSAHIDEIDDSPQGEWTTKLS
jgi:hypothetical protein